MMNKNKTKWQCKYDHMGNKLLWERMIGDFGENMAFEMYAVQKDAFTGVYYVGGGTFKLTDYPAEERNFQLRQHNIDPTDTSFENVMRLAEALFTANLADWDIESTKKPARALSYVNYLVERDFVELFNGYVTLGYKFVEFCKPEQGGFVMVFDTDDQDVSDLPKRAFDIPEVRTWMEDLDWWLYEPDVRIIDLSGDVRDVMDGYDWEANYPVMHINDSWHDHEGWGKEFTFKFTLGDCHRLIPHLTLSECETLAERLVCHHKESLKTDLEGIEGILCGEGV